MAESVAFSLASKILSVVASPMVKKAYEKGVSIWEAKDELAKLETTIKTIQAVLLDAEMKHGSSFALKDWIRRLKDVLYDADDLFDGVATDELLKQQMVNGNYELSLKKKVRVSYFDLNPIVFRNSISKKVKDIRKRLSEISSDIQGFGLVSCINEEVMFDGLSRKQDSGSFVDAKNVIGREEDLKVILEGLFEESYYIKLNVPTIVIAVVGIGGMGKTTLAQLVYNNNEVRKGFNERWFACISDTLDEKEILGRIFQSMAERSYNDFTVGQLQTKIRESIEGRKFLLVLDDVWDDRHGRWQDRISLFSSAAKGSKILITTRLSTVARSTNAFKTHNLDGLSEEESWLLFKRVAFTQEKENDPRWIDLGLEILKKCRNVPLAIKCIGSLLIEKNSLQEWKSFKDTEISILEGRDGDYIMNTLKLSYSHLPSTMKHCFAYCSLFPKDATLEVKKLIYLWIAQGYIDKQGESCFMYLLRRGFFQEAKEDICGEIESCKMHDLIHDLAQHVAGEESIVLNSTSWNTKKYTRHARVEMNGSLVTLSQLCSNNKLRSFFIMRNLSQDLALPLQQLLANFKLLRTLSLRGLSMQNVLSAFGELKYLRHLELTYIDLKSLPDSLTDLLNLITLDVRGGFYLEALPSGLKKLINLRHLNISNCEKLHDMPPGMGEMTCLHHLSDFKVGKTTSKSSGLDSLVKLVQLRGNLVIEFELEMEDWDGDEDWKLPVCLQNLSLYRYPGTRIPDWGSSWGTNNLVYLLLVDCLKVRYLPPLRFLPYLKHLILRKFKKLEFIEDGENGTIVAGSLFFPRLESLELYKLPKLKGWSRNVVATTSSTSFALLSFPDLSTLEINFCPLLKSIPLCPCLHKLILIKAHGFKKLEVNCLSFDSSCLLTRESYLSFLSSSSSSSSFILLSPHLQDISISRCQSLTSMSLEQPILRHLIIVECNELRALMVSHRETIENLCIEKCPRLKVLRREEFWKSFTNLRKLILHPLPTSEKLPQCLRHRQALGQLQITNSLDSNDDDMARTDNNDGSVVRRSKRVRDPPSISGLVPEPPNEPSVGQEGSRGN